MPGCTFQDSWLIDPQFSSWIAKGKTPNTAICKVCNNKPIDLTSMGRTAVISHMKGKKHTEKLNFRANPSKLTMFFASQPEVKATASPPPPLPSSEQALQATSSFSVVPHSQLNDNSNSKPSQVASTSLNSFVSREDTLRAEIWWCLNTVDKNHSFSSNNDISFILQQMFPTSTVAQKFTCGETKSMYLAVHGIAPYFSSLLHKQTLQEPYVLLFDESLNKHMQTKQLDLWLRLWNADTVQSKYFDSSFLGHACASDLINSFEEKVEGRIGLVHMAQLSMDGPSVNWATFDKLQTKIENETSQKLINVGSCGLHQLHNSFKSAVNATTWDIQHILSSLYTLFKHTPARRQDYELVTKQDSYPLIKALPPPLG